ncbi:MAG: TorA maturation chaperone TorD [Sulfurimonas sp.]
MNEQANLYNFFASFFLELPNNELVKKMRQFESMEATDEGTKLLKQYALSKKGVNDEIVLEELAIDRTYLMRGTTKVGPRPPYELVYANGEYKEESDEALVEITKIYQKFGMKIVSSTNDRPDFLGIELAFMAKFCDQDDSKEIQKSFLINHLGNFSLQYSEEVLKFSRTDFYKGIALLLAEFIRAEVQAAKEAA